jgi:SAM-dependent methyltransferase
MKQLDNDFYKPMSWWQNYFIEGWEPVQHLVKTRAHTQLESEFIAAIMEENNHKRLLDVPCGSGRIALALAQYGFETVGIEYNPNAIEAAKANAKRRRQQKRTHFEVGDMRQLDFNAEFDMAACVFNSFGYFDDADNERFIAGISRALKKNGSFLLDCHVLETLLPAWSPSSFWRFDDLVILEEREWDLAQSRMNGQWTFIKPDAPQQQFNSSVRMYSYKELSELLGKYKLIIESTYSGYDGEPYLMGNDSMLIVARKK